MRKALLVLAVLPLALGGCGKGEPTGDAGSAAAVDLTISVKTDEGAEAKVMTLTCDPVGGDHPNAQAACDKLDAAAPAVFEPVPSDQMCTKIYGGPQTATIAGTFHGKAVEATFNRSGGCEIDRWDQLGTEVFDVPLQ